MELVGLVQQQPLFENGNGGQPLLPGVGLYTFTGGLKQRQKILREMKRTADVVFFNTGDFAGVDADSYVVNHRVYNIASASYLSSATHWTLQEAAKVVVFAEPLPLFYLHGLDSKDPQDAATASQRLFWPFLEVGTSVVLSGSQSGLQPFSHLAKAAFEFKPLGIASEVVMTRDGISEDYGVIEESATSLALNFWRC